MSQSRGAAKNSCKLRALDTKKNERLDGRRKTPENIGGRKADFVKN